MSEETEPKDCCTTVTQEIVTKDGVLYCKCPECGRETKEVREEIQDVKLPFPTIS